MEEILDAGVQTLGTTYPMPDVEYCLVVRREGSGAELSCNQYSSRRSTVCCYQTRLVFAVPCARKSLNQQVDGLEALEGSNR